MYILFNFVILKTQLHCTYIIQEFQNVDIRILLYIYLLIYMYIINFIT